MLNNIISSVFYKIPKEYEEGFKNSNLKKNINRFSILPFFNIITQLSCIFIYLYVYPTVYPERVQINASTYLLYTTVYCLINIVAVIYFIRLRKQEYTQEKRNSIALAVYLYIMAYVVLESAQVAIELEISGNIYRFLATFFMVSFFPVIGRLSRFFYMTSYMIVSEIALILLKTQGVELYSYVEINMLIYIVCLIASNVYHNSVIKNYELHRKLEFLSLKDELTGLSNRRSMNQYFEKNWKLASRSNSNIGAIMIDIDHFKKYNDTYGHQTGDECLIQVAKAIKDCFERLTDMTARYGGEEFVIVLSHTSEKEIAVMAERIRSSIENLNLVHEKNHPYQRVTCSIGAALRVPGPYENHELLLKLADDALYKAKEKGRNRIEFADVKG